MSRQKTSVIVRLVLEQEDKILFLKKTHQNGGGYSLIGGKVENGESASEAIIREGQEEANISFKRKHLRLVNIFKRDSERELILIYSVKKWKGHLESKEPEKFTKVVWLPKTDLPRNISEVTRHILKSYFEKHFFTEEHIFNNMIDE